MPTKLKSRAPSRGGADSTSPWGIVASMSEKIRDFIEVPQDFLQDGTHFMQRCKKPDQKGVWLPARRERSRVQSTCKSAALSAWVSS